ncbi:hypothetical protein CL634_08780 [bacterium]|nr:hypothetical protein [bacterium]
MRTLKNVKGTEYVRLKKLTEINDLLAKGWMFCSSTEWHEWLEKKVEKPVEKPVVKKPVVKKPVVEKPVVEKSSLLDSLVKPNPLGKKVIKKWKKGNKKKE